jgi:hypothetical protein
MTPTASPPVFTRDTGGIMNRLRRIEAWLDARGRKAWIAAMILGFMFVWPVGFALVAYITVTNRWSTKMFSSRNAMTGHDRLWPSSTGRTSGNAAFDAYKADTLKRLEDEQGAFEAFLQRLREAKDKSEFDAFMDDRAKGARIKAEDAPHGDH